MKGYLEHCTAGGLGEYILGVVGAPLVPRVKRIAELVRKVIAALACPHTVAQLVGALALVRRADGDVLVRGVVGEDAVRLQPWNGHPGCTAPHRTACGSSRVHMPRRAGGWHGAEKSMGDGPNRRRRAGCRTRPVWVMFSTCSTHSARTCGWVQSNVVTLQYTSPSLQSVMISPCSSRRKLGSPAASIATMRAWAE